MAVDRVLRQGANREKVGGSAGALELLSALGGDAMQGIWLARRLIGCLMLLVLALIAGACTCKWESKGPFNDSGPVRHILVDPADSKRLYAASENGGLWVLDNAESGNAWRPLTDELDNLQMRGIAKSIVDEDYIVTATRWGSSTTPRTPDGPGTGSPTSRSGTSAAS